MKFCFVILHYKTSEDTIKCVQSINKNVDSCDIVIVDNASDNGSIEKVANVFKRQSNITIIKNDKNLGFAAGNNVGYKYARETLKSDFIAISNNDIVIDTPDFVNRVKEIYNEKKFDVFGPDIESLFNSEHQNPMQNEVLGVKEVKKEILRYRILYMLSKMHLYDILKTKKKKCHSCNISENVRKIDREQYDVVLHGSFVVFSPTFVEKEKYSFRPGTFLYMEELILYRYCKQKKYTTYFCPQVKVYHKEDSSTNALFKMPKKKREFVFKNMIKSLKVYRKILVE